MRSNSKTETDETILDIGNFDPSYMFTYNSVHISSTDVELQINFIMHGISNASEKESDPALMHLKYSNGNGKIFCITNSDVHRSESVYFGMSYYRKFLRNMPKTM